MDYDISLDFDGVLHNYTEWTGVTPEGPPVDGALATVGWLLAQRYSLVISSARANDKGGQEAITRWLAENGFPPIPVSLVKPAAKLYIDDRGFRFDGDFRKVIQFLTENPKPGRWGK